MRLRLGGLLIMTVGAGCQPTVAPTPQPPGVAADVAHLASLELGGRPTGTPESDSAAAYIARQYERLGLTGAFRTECNAAGECRASYFQFFRVNGLIAQNIAVVIPGADSSRRDQYVVVGAHYDHLGRATMEMPPPRIGRAPLNPRNPDAGRIRPGADDNASGTAALLELARRLTAHPTRLSILLVNFDAEELGLVGSGVFVEHLPVPRQSIVLMINLDMVGRLRDGTLIVDTSAANGVVGALVDTAAAAAGLHTIYSSETAGRSDHASFGRFLIPAVSLFTGFHPDYHRASDVAERINVRGIELVVDVTEAIVRAVANTSAGVADGHRDE